MRKVLVLCLGACLYTLGTWAQVTPKWVEKAKRAVFSVVTYDKEGKMMNTGNGFFVSDDGVALSDYSLFRGAARAEVISVEGKKMPVSVILGADDMYDVIKFQVAITGKKVHALDVAATSPAVGDKAWMLPYSTQKSIACVSGTVKEVSKGAANSHYYTLEMALKDKMVSCPLMNEEGEVFGIAQKASGADTASICYAVEASYGTSLRTNALSLSDHALKDIGILTGLPDTEKDALVYLMMASANMTQDNYKRVLDEFIARYPENTEGYYRRSSYFVSKAEADEKLFKQAEEDMDKAMKIAKQKDDVFYNRARLVYNYLLSSPKNPYKEWTYDFALLDVREAISLNPLPVYWQLEGDILFAKQDYAGAFVSYEKVNGSNLASPASFYSAAKAKELSGGDIKAVMTLMDSCVARCPQPLTAEFAPYVLERAQLNMKADNPRQALQDYDAYGKAMNGRVNDVFYYYCEQAAMQAHQYQRALDAIAKAIQLNPKELTYQAEQAVINMRVGRNEQALAILTSVLKQEPAYGEGYRLLGLCYIQLKQNGKACENFRKAKELGDTAVDALIEKYCK